MTFVIKFHHNMTKTNTCVFASAHTSLQFVHTWKPYSKGHVYQFWSKMAENIQRRCRNYEKSTFNDRQNTNSFGRMIFRWPNIIKITLRLSNLCSAASCLACIAALKDGKSSRPSVSGLQRLWAVKDGKM